MKVLVLTTTFPRWKNDTTPAFVYELSRKLNEEFDIIVLAPHHERAKRFEIMDGMKVYRFPYFYPAKYQKLVYEAGILPNFKRSHLAKIQVPLLLLSELFYAFEIIRKEKIDVIHSHWIVPSGLIGGILKKILGIKHILTIHASGLFALEELPLKTKVANFILKNTDKITVVSSYVGERLINLVSPDLKEVVKKKMSIISMGIHTKLFQTPRDTDQLKSKYKIYSKYTLLFMGRLVKKKGLSYLIEATSKVLSEIRDLNLVICGNGPLRKELEQFVRKMGLEKSVRFTGYVTGGEKNDYLSLSDVLIAPSIVTQSGDTEGLPVVILEGLAAGKLIIASDVGGVRDVIKDGWNGFLVEQKDPDQIAEKVLELLNNEELTKSFSKNALIVGENYDWKIISRKYGEIITR